MKTDREKLIDLLTEFDVSFKEKPIEDGTPGSRIKFSENYGSEKVKGYSFFYTEFVFDADGKFNHVGIWE